MNPNPTFTPEEIAEHLEYIQKTDNFPSKNWIRAANYFQKVEEKGIDITDAIPYLIDIFRECNNVTIMIPAGAAIMRYYLSIKDYNAIQPLVVRAAYPNYFLSPLRHYYEKKIVPNEILRLMMPYAEKHKNIVYDLFKFHVVAKEEDRDARIANIVELFKEFFKEKTAHSRWLIELGVVGIDISQSLFFLLESLGNEKEKKAIASDLSWANLSGIDLSRAKDILLPFLSDESINKDIALALARADAQKEDFKNLDELLECNSVNIQKSVIQAMYAHVCNTASSNYEFIHRILKGLYHEDNSIQFTTLNWLLMIQKKGLNIEPNEEDLSYLIGILGKTTSNKAILSYLARYCDKTPTIVATILKQLQNGKNQQLELVEFCKNITQKKYTSICSVCETIPRKSNYWNTPYVPNIVQELIPKINQDDACVPTIRTCPKCSAHYLYEHEIVEDFDGMGTDHAISIQRLLTVELTPYLQGQALEDYKNQLNDRIARYHYDLKHPVRYLREDAAYALLIYYKSISNFEAINQLILQPNEDIVLVIVAYFNEDCIDKIKTMPLEVLSNIKNCITRFERHAEIQTLASHLYATKTLLKNEKEVAMSLMVNPSDAVRDGAFKALFFLYLHHGLDIRPYEEVLLGAIDDKNKNVSSHVIYLLNNLIENNKQNFDAKIFIQNQLGAKAIKKQEQGLDFLKIYMEVSRDYAFAVPFAIQKIENKNLTYNALNILKTIPLTEITLQTAILACLEKELKKRKTDFSSDLLMMIYSIYNQGIPVEHLLPEIAVWLNLDKRKNRYGALQILTLARKKGVDLSFAQKELEEANLRANDSYDHDITYILMYIYLNNNDSKAVTALLTDKSRGCRTAAMSYLNEYPKKATVEISGFIEAVIANTGDDYLYIREDAHKALGYFQNRNVWDKKLIDSLL